MKRLIVGLSSLGLAIGAAVLWLLWGDLRAAPIAATDIPASAEQIQAGEYIARAGNCIACHTVPGQPPYSGARRIPTPFGDIYSTNLTPDPDTGLGGWTSADFYRALREGRDRHGRRLYPAFPYPNYQRITRADADALFAFLQSLPPVQQARPAASLRFPYNTQLALIGWRALYFERQPEASDSAQQQRGEYLVEGLGHCNACHTPRNLLGGLRRHADYAGGPIPLLDWDALPLAGQTPLSDAEADDMKAVLKNGTSARHVASGPMAEVVFHSLQYLTDADIAAMVGYIRTLPAPSYTPRSTSVSLLEVQKDTLLRAGQQVYQQHCQDCHGEDGDGEPYTYPALAHNPLVTATSAANAIRTVLYGGYGPSTAGHPRPYGMPPYSHTLSKAEIAAVLTYIRASFGNDASAVATAEVERY